MPTAVPDETFIGDVITEQEPDADSASNEGSDVEDQLDKDDGLFSTQTVHDFHDMNTYGLPDPRPEDEHPSESIDHDAKNARPIPVSPPKISVPRDVARNGDAFPPAAKNSPESTPQTPTSNKPSVPKEGSIAHNHISHNKLVFVSLDIKIRGETVALCSCLPRLPMLN